MCYCHILRYCNLSKRFALYIFSLHIEHCCSKLLWMFWRHQIIGKWCFNMERKKDHRSWVWSILAQCQNTWLLLVITCLATKVCNKWCATANFDHLCHRGWKKAVFCDDCVFLTNCLILIFLFSRTCSSTSAERLWQQLHSSSVPCLCSDMSLYNFGLEPLSCHTWNKDRTRRWNTSHFLIQ